MPRYDFRCRTCGATFEVTRPMADASASARCPEGHRDTIKLMSLVAVGGRASAGADAGPAAAPAMGGGCCGGACGCG